MAKVYISSTFEDLREERAAASRIVRQLGHQTVAMEDYAASDGRPLDRCLADVRDCQLYVGIVAWRYGFVPKGHSASITQLEYEEAGKLGIPRLIFVLDQAVTQNAVCVDVDQARIREFRRLLIDGERHMVGFFRNPDHLAAQIGTAVSLAIAASANKPPIPPILPYLCDRSDQEAVLANAFRSHQASAARRPLFCVIHGDDRECHDAFIERLEVVTLPRLLNLDTQKTPIRPCLLPWPSSYGRGRTRLDVFQQNLMQAVQETMPDSREDSPVILHTYLLSEDWLRAGQAVVECFLRFWKEHADLPPNRFLLVCLCFRHQSARARSLFMRIRMRLADRRIRTFLDTIDVSAHAPAESVVLPELTAVRRGEVEEWSRMKTVTEISEIHQLIADVRRLYEQPELCSADGFIPMERLAPELKRLLVKHRL